MRELGVINERKLIYQKHATDVNWEKALPNCNWVAVIIVNDKSRPILDEISRKIINHNACYVCCAGSQSELLHDLVDEEIVFREVDVEGLNLPPFDIITTWDNNIDDALWYAAFTATHDTERIDTVLCLDTTGLDIEETFRKLKETIK
ncbi:DUF7684 family protein [Mucilaginibacter aquariorum]|uniref:DUF7684 domain-containing protein n=1 Tax=Mucilaginibacter aquariorum TaxID=2967225 RepID=A0ABT1T502_9SPHI|nr:hypothetical protein [Mucilaginibacter aquariorum]MCQ6959688.1 hypothetical protein [Mucilaginibacter aquariorum]